MIYNDIKQTVLDFSHKKHHNNSNLIKRNNDLIREGSPSYAVFVSLKLISLTQVAGKPS